MKKYVSLMFTTVCILFFSTNIPAQTVYTLHELCRIADRTAQEIVIAEDDLYIAKQDKKRALSVLLPRFTVFGSKQVYEDPDADKQNPNTETAGLQFNHSFTLNGKELIALEMSNDAIDMKAFSLEQIRSDYLYEIIQSYYQILSAREYIGIAESNVKRLTKHKNAVQERVSVGNVTRTALFRAKAELSRSQTELVKAENSLKLAKASLKNLVDIDEKFTVIEEDTFDFGNFAASLEEITIEAIEKRPEIKEARKALESAEKNIRYEKGAFWPSLSLEGVYSDINSEYDEPQHYSYDMETKSIAAEITFTLFDGGLRRAELRQALAERRKAQNALISAKKAVKLESQSAWLDYQTAKSTLQMLKDELKSAKENFEAVKMQFKYGMADSVDMMDANTLLVTSQKEVSDGRYELVTTMFNIIRVKGELLAFLDRTPSPGQETNTGNN